MPLQSGKLFTYYFVPKEPGEKIRELRFRIQESMLQKKIADLMPIVEKQIQSHLMDRN